MNYLIALSCLCTLAIAKPSIVAPTLYSAPLIGPPEFSYSSYVANHPLAYSALAAPIAHTVATAVAPAITVEKTQYHAQDVLGQASYGHSEAFQAHNAIQDAAGNKVGSYSYVAPDGQVISTNYVADALGYRAASNVLPVAPSVGPVAPLETSEVLAARAAHLKEYEVAKSRSRRSVVLPTPVAYSSVSYTPPLVHSIAAPLAYTAPVVTEHAVTYRVD